MIILLSPGTAHGSHHGTWVKQEVDHIPKTDNGYKKSRQAHHTGNPESRQSRHRFSHPPLSMHHLVQILPASGILGMHPPMDTAAGSGIVRLYASQVRERKKIRGMREIGRKGHVRPPGYLNFERKF